MSRLRESQLRKLAHLRFPVELHLADLNEIGRGEKDVIFVVDAAAAAAFIVAMDTRSRHTS
jgi:hypothetical protein